MYEQEIERLIKIKNQTKNFDYRSRLFDVISELKQLEIYEQCENRELKV